MILMDIITWDEAKTIIAMATHIKTAQIIAGVLRHDLEHFKPSLLNFSPNCSKKKKKMNSTDDQDN